MEVLVVGLDGVDLPTLDSMSAASVTPTLDRLREDSVVAPLESQLPPWTPSAWPSMYTGVNPGKHGVYDFFRFDGYDWDVVNRSLVKEFAVWELLSTRGFSSVVLNVPVTHPPEAFDGALVPGYIAPEQPDCYPSGVWAELEEHLGEYSLYGRTLDSTAPDSVLADDLVDLTRMRGDGFEYLVEEYEPDFGFVQFQATDTVFHDFPENEAAIHRVYGAVDREVGRLIDRYDPAVTLVVSDHGIGRMGGCEFRVNDFLREEGWAVPTTVGSGMPSWKSLTRNAEDGIDGAVERLATVGVDLASRVGVTSQRVASVLEWFGLTEWVLETVPVDVVRAGTEQVDFPASTAYMRTRTEMGVRLNVEGREPNGTVSKADYEAVRSDLMAILSEVEAPDGEPVFERVAGREDVFSGPNLEAAPDIVTVPAGFDHFLAANLKGTQFGVPTEPYEHKRDGVFMARGPGVDTETRLPDAHLFDIAPTILSAFGVPVSDRMDGDVLPIVDATTEMSYDQFDSRSVGTDSDSVEERLSDLGYLQ